MNELDKLLAALKAAAEPVNDAISQELARSPRQTAIAVLTNDPVIEAFRQELSDGLIRVDTVHQILALVNQVLPILLATGKVAAL